MLFSYNGILQRNENEHILTIYNMNGSQKHNPEQRNLDTKENIQYNSIYMNFKNR